MNRLDLLTGVVVFFVCLGAGMVARGQSVPADAEVATPYRWTAVSENSVFKVEVGPASGKPEIGKFQNWTLHLTDADGTDVFPARFAIGGGMLGHGHGLPTQPRVTAYLNNGLYLIEGMKFNMAGDWTLYLVIETDAARDQVQVPVPIDY
jgi:hypothetical protein